MAQTVAQPSEGTGHVTREEFDALREELHLVLAGAERFFEAGAAWASSPVPRPHPLQSARAGLYLAASEGVALILEAARR